MPPIHFPNPIIIFFQLRRQRYDYILIFLESLVKTYSFTQTAYTPATGRVTVCNRMTNGLQESCHLLFLLPPKRFWGCIFMSSWAKRRISVTSTKLFIHPTLHQLFPKLLQLFLRETICLEQFAFTFYFFAFAKYIFKKTYLKFAKAKIFFAKAKCKRLQDYV